MLGRGLSANQASALPTDSVLGPVCQQGALAGDWKERGRDCSVCLLPVGCLPAVLSCVTLEMLTHLSSGSFVL